jgi:predicted transposase YbfD/YdcC
METFSEKPRLRGLLSHFSAVTDAREQWRVAYPLREVLLLVVCGTIASCDDYDDIVEWGEAHLGFLRRFLPYHHGIPCPDWLRTLMNRVDPSVFSACFVSWASEWRSDAPQFIAIDGKTSRRSHDRATGKAALHLVSAFATNERLVLGQEAVADHGCEQDAIPALLERLAAAGALGGAIVTIDAIACNPKIAADIIRAGANYVLAVKDNQPSLRAEIESYFTSAPEGEVDSFLDHDKGHGRLEARRCLVSHNIGWMTSNQRFPGDYRFPKLAAIAMIEATVEKRHQRTCERRFYIASAPLCAKRFARTVRAHWAIENSLHWVLDVVFKEDLSRLRKGHGAENMAIVRHFAINLVRTAKDRKSIKTRRKAAGWRPDYLHQLLVGSPR